MTNTQGVPLILLFLLLAAPVAAQSDPGDDGPREHRDIPCASLPEKERRQTERCKTDEERREDDYQKMLKEREEKEKPTKSSFLRWLHVDGMWLPGQVGSGTYGLIGTHLAVANLSRVYFFGPPGVLLITEKGRDGRRIRPALSWGVSLLLGDFQPPGTERTAQLYFNVTKCWMTGSVQGGFDMFGLSVSWKK